MSDPLIKLGNYLLEHQNSIDACWTAKVIEEARQQQAAHLEHVQQFLNDMYATMIDPCDQPEMKIAEMCTLLLKTATEQRQQLHEPAERVPSSPAPRLEFQADRMTETEWSADTWLVLPNGKRDVLGWIPCDSQDDADREVATLTKLYAEAVPSSPAAPLDDKELIDKFERAAASADPRMEIWHLLCQIRRGSPTALTPPPDNICPTCGMDIRCVHGKLFAEACEPCETPDPQPCTSSSPCGEIVAKGVCDIGPLAGNRVHEQDDYCLNWHATIRVCLGCGRKEPV